MIQSQVQIETRRITRITGKVRGVTEDQLAIEEPLEIRLGLGTGSTEPPRAISITMRTPGHDHELAVGFLYTEGIIASRAQIAKVSPCGPSGNVVRVDLAEGVEVELDRLKRNFYTSSSCGVCSKSSIEALRTTRPPGLEMLGGSDSFCISESLVCALPVELRASQGVFSATGGLHASGLFNSDGKLLVIREDVGRHNALDKVVGHAFLAGELPLDRRILLVSGRASFELVQKASMAGIPVLAAVGAPSSLAVELAREMGMTLIGFVREGRFNVYCGEERVTP